MNWNISNCSAMDITSGRPRNCVVQTQSENVWQTMCGEWRVVDCATGAYDCLLDRMARYHWRQTKIAHRIMLVFCLFVGSSIYIFAGRAWSRGLMPRLCRLMSSSVSFVNSTMSDKSQSQFCSSSFRFKPRVRMRSAHKCIRFRMGQNICWAASKHYKYMLRSSGK